MFKKIRDKVMSIKAKAVEVIETKKAKLMWIQALRFLSLLLLVLLFLPFSMLSLKTQLLRQLKPKWAKFSITQVKDMTYGGSFNTPTNLLKGEFYEFNCWSDYTEGY